MPTPAQIESRKSGRAAAATVAELALGEAARLSADGQAAFYEELARRLPLPRPAAITATIEPFTDAQARAWGRNIMQFGVYAGRRIDEIPIAYFERLCEPNDFIRHLRRYLASHRVAIEEESESQHDA